MIGGADGCRTGWVICRRAPSGALDIRVVKTLAEACEGLAILAVDMPIGFVDLPRPPRACEVEARKLHSIVRSQDRTGYVGHVQGERALAKLDHGHVESDLEKIYSMPDAFPRPYLPGEKGEA